MHPRRIFPHGRSEPEGGHRGCDSNVLFLWLSEPVFRLRQDAPGHKRYSFDNIPKDYTRPQEERCEDILLGLVGNYPFKLFDVDYAVMHHKDSKGKVVYSERGGYIDYIPRWNNISEVDVTYYRVNAYNFKKAEYTVSNRAYLNMGPCNAKVRCTIKDPSGLVLVKKNLNSYCYYNY